MRSMIGLLLAGILMAETPAGSPFAWKPEPYGAPTQSTAPAPAPVPPAPVVKKKKSHKTTWIVVGCVAGAAAVGLALTAKRLNNEGAGIFR